MEGRCYICYSLEHVMFVCNECRQPVCLDHLKSWKAGGVLCSLCYDEAKETDPDEKTDHRVIFP